MVPSKPCRSNGVNYFELLILEFNTLEIIVNIQEPTHWEKLQQACKINFISHLFVIVQTKPTFGCNYHIYNPTIMITIANHKVAKTMNHKLSK
jgi:hypothetical protein